MEILPARFKAMLFTACLLVFASAGSFLCASLRLFAYFAVKKPLKQLTAKSAKNAKITQRVELRTTLRQILSEFANEGLAFIAAGTNAVPAGRELLDQALHKKWKSHQRELVDGSSPTYKSRSTLVLEIPPTGVGGWFKSDLQITKHAYS